MNIAYLNNKFIPLNEAKVSILDRGFLYGDGAFETMRAYKGIVFHLEKHIGRLFDSLKALGIRPGIDKSKLEKIVYKLLNKNKLKNAYVKIIVTRGNPVSPEFHRATLAVYTLLYKGYPAKIYKKGIKVLLGRAACNEKSRIAGKKTLNYLNNILWRLECKKKKFDDAIFINTNGFISEATSSNIFLVKGRKIFTPCLKTGCLPGITRDEIICLAKKFLKHKVSRGFIRASALYNASEIFLTNSLAEILPVVRVGKRIIGEGKPGPVTEKLRKLFSELTKTNFYSNL